MRSKKNLKIVTLICTLIILVSNILPSLSLAANEISNQLNIQNDIAETEQDKETETVKEETENIENIKQEEMSKGETEENKDILNKEESKLKENELSNQFIMKENITTSQKKQAKSKDSIEIQNLPTYLQTTVNQDIYGEGIYSKRVSVNGGTYHEAFCIQCGVTLHDGTFSGSEVNGKTYSDDDLTDAYKVAYAGWYSIYGDRNIIPGQSDYRAVSKIYAFTQQLIWEKLKQSPRNISRFFNANRI